MTILRPAPRPSSRGSRSAVGLVLTVLAMLAVVLAPSGVAIELDDAEAARLGERVYRNETGGVPSRLLWWNEGEAFASMGIGHFLWFPAGVDPPFRESFPDLLRFLDAQGVDLPRWLRDAPPCPWPDRDAFLVARQGAKAKELEALLLATIPEQSRFLVARIEGALPAMLGEVPEAARGRIEARFRRLLATPAGRYALVDYVNFKGEGTHPRERYQGVGWGLLQVLAAMADGPEGEAPASFAQAAAKVLRGRVERAPPQRGEARWLPGWMARVETYRQAP